MLYSVKQFTSIATARTGGKLREKTNKKQQQQITVVYNNILDSLTKGLEI